MNRRTALVCGILLLIAIVLPLPPLRVYPVVAIDLV